MIRINLLGGTPKARRGGGKPRPVQEYSGGGGGEGPSTLIFVLLGLVLAIAGWYIWNNKLEAEKNDLQKQMSDAIRENQRLADVKAKYEATKRQADAFQRRVTTISDLKAKQTGPHDLLQLVSDTVNGTDALWLDAVTNDGKSLTFIGTALSPNSVADLMANLQKTGKFKSVEIKEAAQDGTVKELQAFKFELICEMLPDTPARPPEQSKTVPAAPKS